MKLEQILTELQHIELSHFRQVFGIVGYGVCVINFLQFSMDHFEIMHTCCGYIEDVQVDFCRSKNNVDKITAFSTSTILRLGFNIG